MQKASGNDLNIQVTASIANLAYTADCRVFRNMTVPEVVDLVLSEHGIENVERYFSLEYRKREIVAQYRETAFNFVHRLFEEEGIWYTFRHEQSRHVLVVGDSPAAYRHGGVVESAFRPVHENGERHPFGEVHSLKRKSDRRPGRYSLKAFHWRKPEAPMEVSVGSGLPGAGAGEVYDWSEYDTKPQGEQYARIRMQEHEVSHMRIDGHGDDRNLSAGSILKLENGEFWTLAVDHLASAAGYSNSFTVLPTDVVYRPARTTPRPSIVGVQSAFVVGPVAGVKADGPHVHADDLGRVRIRFAWDRRGDGAVWARVSQQSAGRGQGSWFLPGVGQEVLVSFVEGDPDLPIIVGTVYHNRGDVPFDPSGTCSGWRTRSAEEPDRTHGNELAFDDARGQEEVRLHAQRDLDVIVSHDERTIVGHDQSRVVVGSQADRVGGNRHVLVKGASVEKTGGAWSVEVGGKTSIKATGGLTIESDGSRIQIDSGGIVLQTGDSYIVLEKGGLRLNGTLIKLNCSGAGPRVESIKSPPEPVAEPKRRRRKR